MWRRIGAFNVQFQLKLNFPDEVLSRRVSVAIPNERTKTEFPKGIFCFKKPIKRESKKL